MNEALTTDEQARLKELEQAFELFNQTSYQLTQAYESLQHQVADLQKQLAESNAERIRVAERLERLLTLLPAGVIVLDQHGYLVEMNASATAILGKDALGRHWDIVVRNVFLTATDAQELIKHDKSVYQLSEKQLDQGQGRILLLQDVTEARALQEHVSRHQRLSSMGEMAASLAHQIRTPLSAALLYVSQLNTPSLSETNRQKFVSNTLGSLQHLESLVNDMLQYAKGGRTKNMTIPLSELFTVLKQSLEPLVHSKQLTIHYPAPVQLEGELVGDLDAIVTALQNLVLNAESVATEQVIVHIEVRQNKTGFLDISVSDNGPGIESELLEKIFEPFYTRRAKGTGLGLAVVRAVAEAHGGECWVNSVKGHGARFIMRLPINSESNFIFPSAQQHLEESI